MTATSDKPQRADARRNRARLLDVAEQVFAAQGLSVTVEEVARQAGVGVGTVYRHFATKEELFAGVLVDRMQRITDHARSLVDAEDAGGAFFEFFNYLIGQATTNRALFEALSKASGVDLGSGSDLGGGLMEAEGELLSRAQASGAVREDIGPSDLKGLLAACLTAQAHGLEPGRMVDIIRGGLRP